MCVWCDELFLAFDYVNAVQASVSNFLKLRSHANNLLTGFDIP